MPGRQPCSGGADGRAPSAEDTPQPSGYKGRLRPEGSDLGSSYAVRGMNHGFHSEGFPLRRERKPEGVEVTILAEHPAGGAEAFVGTAMLDIGGQERVPGWADRVRFRFDEGYAFFQAGSRRIRPGVLRPSTEQPDG